MRGEAEITTLELVEAILNGGKGELKKIRGLTFKEGNNVIVTPERPFIQNLDTLPFPARDLLPNHIYRGLIPFGDNVFTLITATRGCPFKCHFCSVPQFWHVHRRRTVENVLEEITNEELMELFNNIHREFYCRHEIEKIGRDILGLVKLEEEVVEGVKNLNI